VIGYPATHATLSRARSGPLGALTLGASCTVRPPRPPATSAPWAVAPAATAGWFLALCRTLSHVLHYPAVSQRPSSLSTRAQSASSRSARRRRQRSRRRPQDRSSPQAACGNPPGSRQFGQSICDAHRANRFGLGRSDSKTCSRGYKATSTSMPVFGT